MEDFSVFNTLYEDICALSATEGPNTNVNEPKYAARAQMEQLRDTVLAAYARGPSLVLLRQLCRTLVFLGSNLVELEEEKEGAELLLRAFGLVRRVVAGDPPPAIASVAADAPPFDEAELLRMACECADTAPALLREADGFRGCTELLRTLNALGLFLSAAGRPAAAGSVLRWAEREYDRWSARFEGPAMADVPVDDAGRLQEQLIEPPEARERFRERFENDTAVTGTYFFLAQVLAAAADQAGASKYCHLTMYHQMLNKQEFSRRDWASNALQLSSFYASHRRFGRALHCLRAAEAVMPPQPGGPDPVDTHAGEVAWGFGRYHLARLRHYGAVRSAAAEAQEGKAGAAPDAGASEEEEEGFWVDFPVDGVAPARPQPAITDFAGAREEFKRGKAWLERALGHYPFEDMCTSHIQILQDIAALYGALMTFEASRERSAAMVQRQIALTEAIPAQLNFNAYPVVVRQLLYDLAYLHQDLLRLRREQRQHPLSGDKPLKDAAYNALVARTLRGYSDFCETWRSPTSGEIPAVLDEDSRVPYFRALMQKAQVMLYFACVSPQMEYDNIGRAIAAYEHVRRFAEENQLVGRPELEKELALVNEMIRMLPVKQRNIAAVFNRSS